MDIFINCDFGGLPLFLGFSFSNALFNFFDLPRLFSLATSTPVSTFITSSTSNAITMRMKNELKTVIFDSFETYFLFKKLKKKGVIIKIGRLSNKVLKIPKFCEKTLLIQKDKEKEKK
ncbi:hypothetical protein BpHYR1_001124 [Brachionus plicatilis]|uniref:Uncharacterized protein n=1 Tax=Brachionus plicatilis TaxID=10195 RepID=A0A3M7P0X1_BRAPC|nr:hypothetical protein BpHYR1_001124 [Brachionus plicatilis]